MKRVLLNFLGSTRAISAALAQLHFTTTTDQELSSPGDFNGDGLVDIALVDRESGQVRLGLASADGSLTWRSDTTGVEGATLLAVGPFFSRNNNDRLAVASATWNRIEVWEPASNGRITVRQRGIGLTLLAAGEPKFEGLETSLLAVTDQNAAPATHLIHIFGKEGGNTEEFPDAQSVPMAWGNPIHLRAGINPSVGAIQGTNWISATGRSLEPEMRIGLPMGSRFVNGRFVTNVVNWNAVFWKPGRAEVQTSVYVELAPREWSNWPDYVFPQPLRGAWVIEGQPHRMLVLFNDGSTGGLYEFANQTPSVLRQSVTAPAGEQFTAAVSASTASGGFCLFSGRGGISEKVTHWTYDGTQWTQGPTTSIPPLSSAKGRPNVFLFSAEPLVNPKAVLLDRQSESDWTSNGGALIGSRRTLTLETFGGPQMGLIANGSVAISDSTATFVLANQLLPAASATSLAAGSGALVADVRFTPAPGRYPAVSAHLGERFTVTLTAANAGDDVFFRTQTGSPWTKATEPIELSGTTTIQAYAGFLGRTAGSVRSGTYTLESRPQALTPSTALDANRNGLADAWEKAFNQSDPNADTDGDGANALAEQNAGTDPRDASSRPTATEPQGIVSLNTETGPDGPILKLKWPAPAGNLRLQSSADLLQWDDIVPQPTGREYQVLIESTRLFFRLREL